ncbi:hypothetical protein ACER0C_016303 [Sarotherodon galilaeus]
MVAIFTAAQETLIVDMVRGNNLIRLREIRDKVIADNVNFESTDDVSLATIDRVLRRQKTRMKQRILQLDAMARSHEYLFLDEAGFNLQKRRQRGRNIIGQRAITEVPGQRGEEFFSSWRWKVYDRQPYTRENLLRAMELACVDIPAEAFQGWIRHSRASFPWCLARDNIACNVDEVMWPDAAQRHDAAQ